MSPRTSAASVHAACGYARRRAVRSTRLLQYYAMEAVLYRLSKSPRTPRASVLRERLMLRGLGRADGPAHEGHRPSWTESRAPWRTSSMVVARSAALEVRAGWTRLQTRDGKV